MVGNHEILDWIARESAEFAHTIRTDTVDLQVPSCPEWKLRDLVGHLARVQTFWAQVIRRGADVQPAFPDEQAASGPHHADALLAHMRAATDDLIQALRDTPWDTPAWVWWKEPRDVGAIGRHQAQEAAVHRWDAQLALGSPDPIPDALAVDAVVEFVANARDLRGDAPVELRLASGPRIAVGPVIEAAA